MSKMSVLCVSNRVQIVGGNFPYFKKQIWWLTMYYWHNGNVWTFLYNVGTPLIDSMVNQSFLSIQPLLLIFILNLILRLSTFLCPCLFVSFLYHLMNTIFQCCTKTPNNFHHTKSTNVQLPLIFSVDALRYCCLPSNSKHDSTKIEQKEGEE